jgi:hypothetical protein
VLEGSLTAAILSSLPFVVIALVGFLIIVVAIIAPERANAVIIVPAAVSDARFVGRSPSGSHRVSPVFRQALLFLTLSLSLSHLCVMGGRKQRWDVDMTVMRLSSSFVVDGKLWGEERGRVHAHGSRPRQPTNTRPVLACHFIPV